MHGVPLLMDGLSSAMRSSKPHVLFEWSERARHFNQRIVPLRPPPDPEVASELAELRMLRREARGDWLATPRAAELRDDLRRRQWSETSAAGIESLVTMDELREALEPGTALLSFVWSEGRMVCLVVTADIAQVIEIPAWQAAHAVLGGRDLTSTCRHRCVRVRSQPWSGNPWMTGCARSPMRFLPRRSPSRAPTDSSSPRPAC